MKEPLVSVIVPVYNTKKYLAKCVNSLLSQTYTNLEIILVDDGSTDGSSLLCDNFEDDRIRVFHQENGGISSARNTGLDNAIGDYVAFVDSDDYLDADAVVKMVRAMLNTNSQVCMMHSYIVDVDYRIIRNNSTNSESTDVLSSVEFLHGMCRQKYSESVCDKLFLKSALAGLYFEEGNTNEDFVFMSNLLVNSKDLYISIIDFSGYYYYQRPGSISHSDINGSLLNSIHNSYRMMKKYSQEKPLLSSAFASYALIQLRAVCILMPSYHVFKRTPLYKDVIGMLAEVLYFAPKDLLGNASMLYLRAVHVMPYITLPIAHTLFELRNIIRN